MIKSKLLTFIVFLLFDFIAVFVTVFFALIFGYFYGDMKMNIIEILFGTLGFVIVGGVIFIVPCVFTCLFFIKTRNRYKKLTHEKLCSMVGFLSCLIWAYVFGFYKVENIMFHPLVFGVIGAITSFIVAKILNRPEKGDIY